MKRALALILAALLLTGLSAAHAYAEPAATGSIAGTVTDQVTGKPIPAVRVYACSHTGGACETAYAGASTDAAGHYLMTGVPVGEYKVCFIHDDYARECYDDWPYESAGTAVKVGPDEAVTGIDAALLRAGLGRIRGRALDSATGEGVPNTLVAVYGWILNREWHELQATVTDAAGRYELSGLEGGTYRLRFGADGYPTRFYRNGRSVEDAVDVGLGTGQTVEGVEMAMTTFGHIAGRVTNAAGEPLAAITVKVDDYWNPAGEAQTDALGRYDIGGLEEGEHRVEFRQAPIEYEPQPPHDYGPIATLVTVRLGETTGGIDQAMPAVGSLRATFIDFYTGQPIPGVAISVFPNPQAWFHDATSDANGQVTIGSLDPGQYQVIVRGPEGDYDMLWPEDTGPVVIRSGEVTEKQWVLKGGPRIVRGRITDAATGTALEGISVNLLGSRCHWRTGCHEYNMASVLTDAQGRFEYVNPSRDAVGLAATDPRGIYDEGGVPYRYPERGETVVVDAALQTIASKYGEFAGRVTGANGAPLAGTTVTAYRQDAAGQQYSGSTGADGTYRFRAAAGAYKLAFQGPAGYYTEVYDDQSTADDGQMLWITASEVTTANAALASWGGIEGTVRTEAGQPLAGADVWLYRPCGQSWCVDPHQHTGADGRYRYTLPDGVYRVKFEASGRDPLIWGGAATIEEGADITVANGRYETIGATLRAGGILVGQVTDRDTGQPVPGIRVIVGQRPVTDDHGRFVMGGLRTGAYVVQLSSDTQGRYPRQYYDDGSGGSSPSRVQVMAGMTTTIAITLQPPGRAVGRVTDANGNPLEGIEVKVQQPCCYEWKALTDANGRYESPLVNRDLYADDDYTVLFNDPQKHYQAEYADDSQTAHKTRIMPGQVVTLDAALDRLPSLSGVVTDASGAPLSDVHVWVGDGVRAVKGVYTGGNGAYLLDYVPAGPTKLVFDYCCRRYLPITRAMTFTLNTDYPGMDAQMLPWGKLRGRVTDEATGQPIPKVWVKLYRRGAGPWAMATSTVTAADGTYAFRGLDSGTYRLEFAHPQGWYVSEAYPDAPSIALGGDIAFVREADTAVDAALVRNGDGPPMEPRQRLYLPMVAAP